MPAPKEVRAWHGLRTLIETLPSIRTPNEIESLREEHWSALARVPGLFGPNEDQDPDNGSSRPLMAAGTRPLMAARTLSHLSHNFLLQKPLFEALADFVNAATADTDTRLVVPDLAVLDRESLGLLRTLFRRHPQTAPSLIAGFDPDRVTPEPDADGLIWELNSEEVWQVALGFLSLPEAEAIDLPKSSDPSPDADVFQGPHGHLPPSFSDLSTSQKVANAVGDIRTAFQCFAFETTLRGGLALVRGDAELSPRHRADVHGLIALAAHNRQFRSSGNRRLAEFLCEHLNLALEAEDRPAERSALCYRLAVAHGRRLKDRQEGLLWSERAIEEAGRAELPAAEAAILEAWGRNIKSFMLTTTGRLPDAAEECKKAYSRLDRALETEETPLQSPRAAVREAAFSRSILADNLGAIHQMSGDVEGTRHWKTISDGHNRQVPEVERYEAPFWIATYRDQLRFDAARDRARRGLNAARRDQDALREYRYGIEVADLSYRLRDAKGALTHFKEAENLHARVGAPSFLRLPRLAPAAAASRAGQLEEALARIDSMLSELPADRLVARSQVLALKGLCLARAGHAEPAETAMNEAIDLAVDSGERDLLLSVAVSAGRASQLLQRDEDAREAYLQAVEISAEKGESDVPAGLELAAHLGFLETSEPSSDQTRIVRHCLNLFEEALEDAETWWRLPRLAIQLTRILPDDPYAASVLERLDRIMVQSVDSPG